MKTSMVVGLTVLLTAGANACNIRDFLVNEIATLRRSAQTELALHCGFGVLPLCLDVVCHRLSRSMAFGVLIVGVAARDQSADALRMGNAAIPDNHFHYVCSNHAHHAVRGGSFAIGRASATALQGLKQKVRNAFPGQNRLIPAKPRPPRARRVARTASSPPDPAWRH